MTASERLWLGVHDQYRGASVCPKNRFVANSNPLLGYLRQVKVALEGIQSNFSRASQIFESQKSSIPKIQKGTLFQWLV
jgi:hypothetical protein